MIRELTIKNYRGFKDFKIDSFDRVNLIAGANNVGKTSLLEAIYLNLAPTLPDWPTPIKLLRGFESLQSNIDFESMWGWLFWRKNLDQELEISSLHTTRSFRTVGIHTLMSDGKGDSYTGLQRKLLVTLKTLDIHRRLAENQVLLISSNGFERFPDEEHYKSPYPLGVILGGRIRSIEEEAKLFSKIDDAGHKDELLNPLRLLDARLQDLAVSVSSGMPMVHCDIGIGQRIPLRQTGEGMVHYFSILSEIVHSSGGVVLIDEIDNGMHYSVMVDVWKAIAEAAHNSNTQIFATTHSFECISAAHKAFSENGRYDFRLHRLDRINGEIKAITYDKEMLEAALLTDLEVR